MFELIKRNLVIFALIFLVQPILVFAQEDSLNDLEGELEQNSGQDDGSDLSLDEEIEETKPKAASDPALEKEKPTNNTVELKGPDDPDYDLEERTFKIFAEIKSKGSISDSSWKKVVGKRKSENYRIQKGDTLWDISKTLFGDPFYWPKVWAVNEDISNPHFVKTGVKLSFYQGTVSDEPVVDIKPNIPEPKDEPIPPPVAANAVPEDGESNSDLALLPGEEDDFLPQVGLRAETTEDVIIPAPKYKGTSKLKSIPPSLPDWAGEANADKPNSVKFGGAAPSAPKSINVPLTAFIAEDFPDTVGEVIEFKDQATVGTNYQYTYVEVEGGKVGDTFLVITKLEKPKKFYRMLDGVPVSVDGEIKLIEQLEEGEDTFKAVIISNLNPIRKGAKLAALKLPLVELSTIGPVLNVEGKVGGGYMDGSTEYYGVGSFVFLDVGAENGVKVGGLVYALADERLRDRKTVDRQNKRDVGLIKIVHTTSNLATGVVVQANDVIMAGDSIGMPGPLNKELIGLTANKKNGSLLEELADEELLNTEIKGKSQPKADNSKKSEDDETEDFNDDDF